MCARKSPSPAPLPEAEKIDIQALAENYKRGNIDLIVVLGPTASGKTKYAVSLARQLGKAEIISADSRQVYIGMDIGTGKDLSEYGDIPHHLTDIVPAGAQYNVFSFVGDFRRAFEDIRGRGAVPILCGGTGMYISAVTSGYDFEHKYALSSPQEGRVLGKFPPENSPDGGTLPAVSDGSVLGSSPNSNTSTTLDGNAPSAPCKPYFIGTLVSREERNRRIDRRLDERLFEGMVEEVRGLLESGVPAETLISYGLEYKFVTRFILGELGYSQMREQLATAIHQFAKRQMTWFRGMERSGVCIHWVEV